MTLLASGCFSAALSPEEAARARSVLIVPVESPPVRVVGYTPGEAVGLLFTGVVGIAVHEAVTKEDRLAVARQLNQLMRDWRMERALAEECAGVLQGRSVRPLQEVRLAPTIPLPGAPAPTDKEPGPFTADIFRWKSGLDAVLRWRDAQPLGNYASDPVSERANWVLELGLATLSRFPDGSMQIETQAKLIDTATGRTLAKGSTNGRAEPEPLEVGVSEAQRLERQYRAAVRTLCTRMLADMRMIAPETCP